LIARKGAFFGPIGLSELRRELHAEAPVATPVSDAVPWSPRAVDLS
jgi:hypothetical protein